MDRSCYREQGAAPGAPPLRKKCVYCLDNHHLRDDQVLLRGEHVYLCAPRGQFVEGYLAIAPYECIGCFSQAPARYFPEIGRIKDVVARFYREIYGARRSTLYEQGRAGGGAVSDEAGGFPHHAHLCCLPFALDLHSLLSARYIQKNLAAHHELREAAGRRPYVYVEDTHSQARSKGYLYMDRMEGRRSELEQSRLKPIIAARIGIPERGDWRAYPGDLELECVIRKFAGFRQRTGVMCHGGYQR